MGLLDLLKPKKEEVFKQIKNLSNGKNEDLNKALREIDPEDLELHSLTQVARDVRHSGRLSEEALKK